MKTIKPILLFLLLSTTTALAQNTEAFIEVEITGQANIEYQLIEYEFILVKDDELKQSNGQDPRTIEQRDVVRELLEDYLKKNNIDYETSKENIITAKFESYQALNNAILMLTLQAGLYAMGRISKTETADQKKYELNLIKECQAQALEKAKLIAETMNKKLGKVLAVRYSMPGHNVAQYTAPMFKSNQGLTMVNPQNEVLTCKLVVRYAIK